FTARTRISPEGEPLEYRLEGRPARRPARIVLEIDKPGHAYVSQLQEGDESNIGLAWSGPACVVDSNVIAHWAMLARRWRGKAMSFSAVVPQDSTVADLVLEPGGDAPEGGQAVRATL